MHKIDTLLNMICVLLLPLLICSSAFANPLSDSALPRNFNPNTCEEDQKTQAYGYGASCDGLRVIYHWLPMQQAILDVRNALPAVEDRLDKFGSKDRFLANLAALADLTKRIGFEYARPPQEKNDWLGIYLNRSQRMFDLNQLPVPKTIDDVFPSLRERAAKDYVAPDEMQRIVFVAEERAMELFSTSNELVRTMKFDAEGFATRRKQEAQKVAEAKLLESQGTYAARVEHRAKDFRGLWPLIYGSMLIAAFGVFLMRQQLPGVRARLIAWAAGSAALLAASVLAGIVQLITGASKPVTFFLMLLAFGIAYALFRDKLAARFPAIANLQTHGSAAWASLQDAATYGRIFDKGMVSADSFGFALGRAEKVQATQDPRLRYMGHVLTCAPTGSGKGIGAVIPTLLEYPGSTVVLDIKGENYAVTARARRELGQKVYLIDPFGAAGGEKSCFNPIDTLDLRNPDVVGQASALVESLVVSQGDQNDNASHFNDSAKDLIKGLIVYVASLSEPSKRTFGEVRRLLTLPLSSEKANARESLMDHLSDMSVDNELAFGIPARCANGFLSKDSKEASGVHSTALRHTAFLDDPRIAEALSRSDFKFDHLKNDLISVYVVMPPDKLAAQTRFMRVVVGAALSAITANNIKPKFNVLFLLDEFAQLGRMPAIEDAISLVRGYGARFWLFVQDLSQLKGVYPKWQTFLANSAKQFFGTADFETAKYVSDMLGQTTISFQTSGDSSSASTQGGSSSSSTSEQFLARSLLTPDEVMRFGAERPIVLIQGERPYALTRINYLNDPEYVGLADSNPFHR